MVSHAAHASMALRGVSSLRGATNGPTEAAGIAHIAPCTSLGRIAFWRSCPDASCLPPPIPDPADRGESAEPAPRGRRRLAFLLALAVNGLLLWHFHDRYWYPTDDGLYANIAERLLSGEVLQRDIQDIHPGCIHFLHAASMRWFGRDMVSLRYPLLLAALVQSMLAFALLASRGLLIALAASFLATAVGVLQFFNPTPNWYCLSLSMVLAWWLLSRPPGQRSRLVGAGLIVGLLTAFRQLSGVWAAMAVLTMALAERAQPTRPRSVALSRGIYLVMLSAVLWYLLVSPETEPGGVLLIASWPLTILLWGVLRTRTSDADALRVCAQLGLGAVVPMLPLFVYHAAHGSLFVWFSDNVLVAFGETQLEFFGKGWYGLLPLAAFHQVVTSFDPLKIVNGLYWLALMLSFSVNGLLILRHVRRCGELSQRALPVLAAFGALGSLYFEGPLYLYYGVGLVITAVLWTPGVSAAGRARLAVAAIALGLVAVACHAGQSRLRKPVEILEGRRISSVWSAEGRGPLPRADLEIEAADRETYSELVALIQAEVLPTESIWALPNDAELYFLAERRNPLRFYNSALGLSDDAALRSVLDQLERQPPRLVLYRPTDKYVTPAVRSVMNEVRRRYVQLPTVDGLDVYRLPRS
jgi:hypothetical protein